MNARKVSDGVRMFKHMPCSKPSRCASTPALFAPFWRKAFDVAWRDAAMLCLRRAGVTDDLWHLVDDFVTNRTAAIRMES